MSDRQHESWPRRLLRWLGVEESPGSEPESAIVRAIGPAQVSPPPADSSRSGEDWRELVAPGQRVMLSWDGGPRRGAVMAQGEARLVFEETIWVWLDRERPADDRPTTGQALQILAPGPDAMRLIPCQVADEGQGGSLQLTVSGRVSRVQRRDDVRARADLPPVSAVKLGAGGRPLGLLGLEVVDLSAGGIRVRGDETLARGDRLRLVLRLDDGEPLTPTVEVLVGGHTAQGRFGPLPERDRRRIVQYVYRQEIVDRRRAQAGAPAE